MIRTRSLAALLVLLLMLPMLLVGERAAAQATPAARTAPIVDLATVPLRPDELPETGFQLVQAGFLSLDDFAFSIGGDDQPAMDPLRDLSDEFVGAYSQILALFSDRADPNSEPFSGAATYLLTFTSPEVATTAAELLVEVIGLKDPTRIDEVETFQTSVVTTGLAVSGNHVVLFNYTFDEQRFSTQQNTDWTPEVVADVVNLTIERLDDAIEQTENGIAGLSSAGLLFSGPDALWSLPWTWFPSTQHYRVLDGVVLPYGGELDTEGIAPRGVADLYVSRQQIGDDGYDHMVDITLATFDSERDAQRFADDPPAVIFPANWTFEADYGSFTELEPGLTRQTVRVDDDGLRATGWRTVRNTGSTVQVVQWLASENGLTSEQGMADLTAIQSDCLDALPDGCTPLPQSAFPAPIDAESAEVGDFPGIGTPEPRMGEGGTLASLAFGWDVTIPDDGWSITGAEFLNGGEFYRLQSGRSLLTVESVINRAIGPDDCLLDEVGLLEDLEERALITLGSDDPTERKAGLEANHAWGVYTVEPLQEERTDQEYTIRIDCYALVPGEVSLVVTHTAPRDLWIEERPKGERFRDALRLPDPSTVARAATTPSEGDRRFLWRTLAMGMTRPWIPLAA